MVNQIQKDIISGMFQAIVDKLGVGGGSSSLVQFQVRGVDTPGVDKLCPEEIRLP